MHIVVIIGRFYPYWGGAEIRMKQIAEALLPRGFKFTVLTPRLTDDSPVREQISGIDVYRFPKQRLLFGHAVRNWFKQHHCSVDLVHTIRLDKVGSLGAWANQHYQIPHLTDIITNEAFRMLREGNFFGNRAWRKIIAHTDMIHCINREMIGFLKEHGVPETKLWFHSNAVNPDLFTPNFNKDNSGMINVFYSGRFERLKGTDVLIEAWRSLPPDVSGKARLILAGSGKWNQLIREQAEGLTNVIFVGAVGREQVLQYLHEAHIYVHPPRYEGFGNAVLEAMAVGLPIVATKVGGIPDFVESGVNGILIPPEDPIALAEALAKMLRDPELRFKMGRESRRIAVSSFNFSELFDAFELIYRRLGIKRTE
jgi:glycosyltransferase involved in cell wall biosynthesis